MADDIIDLSGIIERRDERDPPAGTMALWGAEGERSRFALPLWRVVHLAGADRGIICWRQASGDPTPRPFIVLDVAHDPARVEVPTGLPVCEEEASGQLQDQGPNGLVVCLGTRDGRVWALVADGGARRPPLAAREREDILFLSGECAGLLFLRDFADQAGQ